MSKNNIEKDEKFSTKFAIAYNIGQFPDQLSYQTFTFLIFTFYFTVVIKEVLPITIGFIIWSIWNAINDPLMGAHQIVQKQGGEKENPILSLVWVHYVLL